MSTRQRLSYCLAGNRWFVQRWKDVASECNKIIIRSLGFFEWYGSPYIDLIGSIEESIRIIEYGLWTVRLLRSEAIYGSWNT
jgi:hypothetical protein